MNNSNLNQPTNASIRYGHYLNPNQSTLTFLKPCLRSEHLTRLTSLKIFVITDTSLSRNTITLTNLLLLISKLSKLNRACPSL